MTTPAEQGGEAEWQPSPFLRLSGALHAGVAVGLAFYPERWAVLLGLIAADHVTLAAAGMWPKSTLLGANLSRLPEPSEPSVVALTFDDGPEPEVTPRVLDLLDERGASASFFCIGHRAEQHPKLVEEIVRRGHRVENHSYRHSNAFAFLGPRALGREIDRAQTLLTDVAGSPPRYFRAPAGIRSPWLDPILASRGLQLASWTRRGFDAVDRDRERIEARLLRNLGAGDVLLMHDGQLVGRGTGPRKSVVLDVLPRVLDALGCASLRAVSLPRGGMPLPGKEAGAELS